VIVFNLSLLNLATTILFVRQKAANGRFKNPIHSSIATSTILKLRLSGFHEGCLLTLFKFLKKKTTTKKHGYFR